MYIGDYTEDHATLDFTFSTRKDTGLPTVLSGSPVISVYKGNGVTPKTSAEAYITLTIDFNSKVGLNHVRIDLSGDAFFAVANDYHVVITTGTVNSISVIGETVATFSIENRFDEVDVTKWANTATSAGVGGDGLPASISSVDRNAYLIESLEGGHTYQGNHYFVDPVNGDTHASGNRGGRTDPYKTIQDCHDNAVTDSNHDVIFLVAGHASTVTTHTIAATTTISKRYLSIRGPGRDFIITRTGSGDSLAVTADGVALSGFQLGTAATGSGHGIKVTDADFVKVEHVWVLDTQGDGVHILRGSNCVITLSTFSGTGVGGTGQGVHIVGTAGVSTNNRIQANVFSETAGDSILIEQGTTNDTLILNNLIHDSAAWGINIGASSTDAIVHGNIFGNNASGNITDAGTTTVEHHNRDWLSATVEGRTLDVETGGTAGVDWGNVANKTTANDLTQTDIQLCDTVTTNTDMVGTDSAALASVCTETRLSELDAGTGGKMANQVDVIETDTTAGGAGPWTTGSGTGLTPLTSGTAQSGTASTLVLAASAAFADNILNGSVILIHTGTGAGQHRVITSNTLSDDTVNVTPNWITNPSSDSQYEIWPAAANVTAVSNVAEDLPTATALAVVDTNVDQIETAVITNATGADVAADIINIRAVADLILLDTLDMQPKLGTPLVDISTDLAAVKGNTTLILADTGTDGVKLLAATQTSIDAIETDTGTTLQAELDAIQAAVITNAAGADVAADIIALKAETVLIVADTTKMVAGIVNGTVDTVTNTHTPTTTEFQADDIIEATPDHWIGRIVTWLTGVLTGQSTDITDSVSVGGITQFTVTAMTDAPANDDTFKIT